MQESITLIDWGIYIDNPGGTTLINQLYSGLFGVLEFSLSTAWFMTVDVAARLPHPAI